MADEKILLINVRKELAEYPRWKRSSKAMSLLRNIVARHSHSGKIIIDKKINETLWKTGARKPRASFRVKLVKRDNNSVKVELME
jgi:ribosomal protein L31E